MFNILYKSLTHVGKVRSNNEDYFHVDPEQNLVIVADGVGGRHFGEIASKLAVESCHQYLTDENPLREDSDFLHEIANSVKYANEVVITVQKNNPAYKNMGTTLTSFLIRENTLYFAYVGDSRIYLIRPKTEELTQLTDDHTLDPSKVDKNLALALYKRASSILTRMVGSFLLLSPDSDTAQLKEGDILLACSDGLSDLVKDEFILEYALKFQNDMDALSYKLLDRALDCGGRDNITFVLAQCQAK